MIEVSDLDGGCLNTGQIRNSQSYVVSANQAKKLINSSKKYVFLFLR
jgi:hypothetical protein